MKCQMLKLQKFPPQKEANYIQIFNQKEVTIMHSNFQVNELKWIRSY